MFHVSRGFTAPAVIVPARWACKAKISSIPGPEGRHSSMPVARATGSGTRATKRPNGPTQIRQLLPIEFHQAIGVRSANCMLSLAGLDAMLWFSFGETGDGEMGAECREGIVLA